jgi:hypothetical protein
VLFSIRLVQPNGQKEKKKLREKMNCVSKEKTQEYNDQLGPLSSKKIHARKSEAEIISGITAS